MQKNLKTKTIVIVVTILVCIYGIIGLPKSVGELKANLAENIKLGLDLNGGSRLVLQVQVQDAVKAEALQTIERMKDELRKANIDFASMESNEPNSVDTADTIQIDIKGIPADKSTAFRSMVADHFATWVLTAVNSTDYRMNMRPSELLALKRDTVERSRQTIEQSHQRPGPHRAGGAAGRPRRERLPDRGATSRGRRSGAREGHHRHGGGARDRGSQGRTVSQPGAGAGHSTAAYCR